MGGTIFMISEQEYFKFSKKLNKILKKCYVGTIYPGKAVFEVVDGYSKQGLSPYYGHSSLTKENCYFFNKQSVIENKDAILELCAILPKLKTVKNGTAGTIAYVDLLPERNVWSHRASTGIQRIILLSSSLWYFNFYFLYCFITGWQTDLY